MAAVRWWVIIRWFGFGWSPLEKRRDQERERECAIRLKNFAETVKLILKSARGYILLSLIFFFSRLCRLSTWRAAFSCHKEMRNDFIMTV